MQDLELVSNSKPRSFQILISAHTMAKFSTIFEKKLSNENQNFQKADILDGQLDFFQNNFLKAFKTR
jgi:hypothetical protein